nr:acetyltransferase [Granulicella sp. dw_53]
MWISLQSSIYTYGVAAFSHGPGKKVTLAFERQRIVVIGAGDHAKVIVEALWAMEIFEVVGFLDPVPASSQLLGLPVLGGDELLPRLLGQKVTSAVVAIGSNSERQQIGRRLLAMGFALPVVLHPSAIISPSATIKSGTVVMARAVVGTLAQVEELAIINTGAIVEHDNHIGEAAHIAPGTALAGRVRVGERSLVGVGSAVRPGVSIGPDSIVGAGSAVVGDVPSGSIVAGTPARKLPNR